VDLVWLFLCLMSAKRVVQVCSSHGLSAKIAGVVEDAPQREVVIEPLSVKLSGESFALGK
jgi:hypothetical protein